MSNKLSKREITKLVSDFYKLTGKSPCLKNLAHLPFSKNRVIKLFGTWNNMLEICNLPLNRNKISEISCFLCKKKVARQVKEIKKSKRSFCSSECNAKYYTTGRKHSEETKRKISESLKAHRIFLNTKKNIDVDI